MKIRFFMPLPLLFAFCLSAIAQDAPTKAQYERETIYLNLSKYYKNGEEFKRGGLVAKNLKLELAKSEAAMKSYRQFKANRVAGLIFSLTGLGMALTAPALDNTSLQGAFLGGGLVLSIFSLPFSGRAERNLQKAVWEHNRDILF
ncbi:MAG: hypothetical protein AAF990_01370 [Bacteroidota bacterium]